MCIRDSPNGKKILVIHGGPGGGSQPRYRRYFDPDKFDIVQFDQRVAVLQLLSPN